MHLIIDGHHGSYEKLGDEDGVYRFLDECPAKISMTKIAPPSVHRYSAAPDPNWGISGFVLIAESHIAIHTFPERGLLWGDIFSCKDFDQDAASDHLMVTFGLGRLELKPLHRGLEPLEPIREPAKTTPVALSRVVSRPDGS